MLNAPDCLAGLPAAERACLELAWEAMLAGTIPVGAVVADRSGSIVATGRNAVYGQPGNPDWLSSSLFAHAEVNAMRGCA